MRAKGNFKKAVATIEILLDLALIAIMTSFVLNFYAYSEKDISNRVAVREIRMLKVAVISYYENQSLRAYPPATNAICADYLLNAKPQVIRNIITDPFSKNKAEYSYTISPNKQFFCIWSAGPNRKSDIMQVGDTGDVVKSKDSDDIYATNTADPVASPKLRFIFF